MREKWLLVDEVPKHKGGPRIREPEEGVHLGPDAVEEVPARDPAEDEETEDELKRDPPDDVSPNYPASGFREQETKCYDNQQASSRYKPAARVLYILCQTNRNNKYFKSFQKYNSVFMSKQMIVFDWLI